MSILGPGELAGLATAACWAACAQLFGRAGLRIGSVAVNHLRLPAAALLLCLLHLALLGSPAPRDLPPGPTGLFVASGLVGLVLGDAALFRAFVLLGPVGSTLVMTLAPGFATLMAWAFLGEVLPGRALAGIGLTVTGVAAATFLRRRRAPVLPATRAGSPTGLALGMGLAVLGAAGQAGGVVLARPALAHAPALSGTLVRMAAAAAAIWLGTAVVAIARRRGPRWLGPALRDRRALLLTAGGTLTGPVSGVWLSLVATKRAPVGVAATLMSVTPLFVLLIEWAVFGRRPVGGELLGAVVAIAGVALVVTSR